MNLCHIQVQCNVVFNITNQVPENYILDYFSCPSLDIIQNSERTFLLKSPKTGKFVVIFSYKNLNGVKNDFVYIVESLKQ